MTGTYADAILAKVPFLFYRLEELPEDPADVIDSSGNNRGTTWVQVLSETLQTRGVPSVSQNPVGFAARSPFLSDVAIGSPMANFTYECLYTPESFPSGEHHFAGRDGNSGTDIWVLRMLGSECQFIVKDTTNAYVGAGVSGMVVGGRYHISARSANTSITLEVYDLDTMALVGTTTTPVPNGVRNNITPPLQIGWAPWLQRSVTGIVDEIALYDRVLSDTELGENRLSANEQPVVELPTPPAPRNLSAFDVADVTASVFWTGFAEGSEEEPAIRYEYTVNGGSVVDNLLSTQVDLTGLTKSTQYVFQVRAVGAQATSDWSEIIFTTTAGAPAVPTALNVHTITNVSAVAEWLAGSGGPAVTGFEYQIDTRPIETVGAQVFSASISGLSSNTEYTLRVRAVGDDGVSDWVEVLFTTFGPPAIPTGLMMSSITATSATANWTKSPTGTNYQYQVDDGVVVTLGDVATVDLIELASATDHIFAVRAQNQYGSSSWVSTTFQTVEGLPDPPSGLYLSSSTSTSVTAAWYAPVSGSAPTGYEYQLDNGSWFDVPSGLRTVTVDGMLPGSQHTLRVRSKNAVGVSSAASTSFTLNPGSPEAPVDVFATQITETSATVKWAPSVSGPPVSGYEYSLDYSAVMDAGLVQQIFLEGMQPNSTHVFRVRGVGEFGVSEWSEVSFTTNAPDEPEPETARIKWNDAGQRFFENGIDRGVLYLTDGSGVAWNGLTGLDEDLGDESTEPFYMDGEKYHDAVMMGDFAGSLRALMYPDEFLQFEGYGTIGQGVYADDQAVNIFALSYRTLIGNDTQGDNMGYKLHIVYNLSAYPDAKVHGTASDSPSLTEFGWNITSVPVHISGHRPTAHIILDSRYMNSFVLRGIEDILYGDGTVQARLPSISELIEFIDNFTFIQIFDNGDGTWTARGPDALIEMMDATTFMIAEANATFLDEDTYTIRDS